jgi:hypothetical protein
MKMPIWNAQQMVPIKKIEAATKCSNRRPQASKGWITMKTNTRMRSKLFEVPILKMENTTPCWMPE